MRVQPGRQKSCSILLRGLLAGLGTLMTLNVNSISVAADSQPSESVKPATTTTLVRGVDVRQESGKLLIDVQTTGTPVFKSFELQKPSRIVVDVLGAQLQAKQRHFKVDQSSIKSVRLAQFSEVPAKTVRAVFLINGKVPYSLVSEENAVRMVVSTPESVVAQPVENTSKEIIPGPAPITAETRPATVVRGVDTRKESDHLVVSINADGVLKYKTFELENPQRLVVDLPAVVLRSPRRNVSVKEGNLNTVRLGQFASGEAPSVRAVFEESKKGPYNVESSSRGLRFVFPLTPANSEPTKNIDVAVEPASSMGEVSVAAPKPEPASAAPVTSEKPAAESEAKPIQIAALKTPEPFPVVEKARTNPVSAPESWATLPEKLQAPQRPLLEANRLADLRRPDPVVDHINFESLRPPVETVVKTEPAKAEPAAASPTPVISPKVEVAQKLAEPEPKTPASVQAPPAAVPVQPALVQQPITQSAPTTPVAPPAASPANPSDIISLDLRDVDIRDFFRLIHEVSGLNVILDPSVRGTLTIALKDVPWEQALDIVLKNNQLGKQLDGSVLRIVTLKSLEEEQNARRKILESQRAEEEAAARKTFTRTPNYLKAKELATIFSQLLGTARPGAGGADDVIFDEGTNMVIVRTTQRKMDDLDTIMKGMDVKSDQVEIEARVVAANRSFLRNLGVQLGFQAFSTSGNNIVSGLPSLNSPVVRSPRPPVSSGAPSTTPGQPTSGPLPLNTDLGATAATSGISYFYTGANFLLDSFISAAESKGTAKLLSKPKIITQNHFPGVVEQGIQIPVQTTVNNTVTVQFIHFSLKMTVTPQITKDGTVYLDANVENSTPDFNRQVGNIPTIQTQQAQTRVLINDGGTVVIGGVLIDQNSINFRQVPGIGNVPVIGNLFKNKSVQTQTQELLFFLTPKILK